MFLRGWVFVFVAVFFVGCDCGRSAFVLGCFDVIIYFSGFFVLLLCWWVCVFLCVL